MRRRPAGPLGFSVSRPAPRCGTAARAASEPLASVTVPQTGPRVASPRVVGGAIGTRRAGGGPATIGATGIIAEYPKAIRPGVSWLEFVDQDIQVELVVELFGYRFAGQG